MSEPFLTVKASGYGGRGYASIFDPDSGPLPGVTTVLKAVAAPALTQWAVDQTAAYAVANIEALLTRTEDQGWGFLRWYWKRTPDPNSGQIDLLNYHAGVLDEAAEMGRWAHSFLEATLLDTFEPTPMNELHDQMANVIGLWVLDNDIEVLATESTVYGEGYAGTFDLLAEVNGVKMLIDAKTSRAVRDSHVAQLGALGAAHTMAVEVDKGTKDAVAHTKTVGGAKTTRYFVPEVLPAFESYAVLQIRPDDVDSKGRAIPAFCELHTIPHEAIEAGFQMFKGALAIKHAEKTLRAWKAGNDD